MKKSEAINKIKTKLLELKPNSFKEVKRGAGIIASVYPYCLIRVPLTEKFRDKDSGQTLPFIHTFDLLLDIVSVYGNDKVEDEELDLLVELVKDKMLEIPDGQNIVGIEWQHDEEWLGISNNEQGQTVWYTVQYQNKSSKRPDGGQR